jgi:atypical dual specificity phosphatase
MMSRTLFYPSLLYNVLMERYAGRHWFDRIDETVILGALPFRSITQQLLRENVHGVVSMTEPHETRFWVNTRQEWAAAGITQLVLSTPDMIAAPTQEDLQTGVKFLLQHNALKTSVYVHCKAGRTRSATLVACYLIQRHRWSPEEAVEFIRQKRPHIKIRPKQWTALKTYHQHCCAAH